ncbi:Cell division protein FtsX [Pigmentiphaga humi]|uniref:Cell division protein FtsX n=1 Tax=Pigmentiphaga humi TaxID=2478468 RepID=A0A3P4B0S3_9BURK|nr:permease-like cell division protein FtsX [Pigmentiphaga humi]VCU68725.1 Cell division protein FtsX [Pigmentiphaga humi]
MNPLIRQHRYAFGVTLRRLFAQPFSSLANILVITLALAIPLLGAAALMSLRPVASHLAADPEMTVFMKVDATSAETDAVADRIRRDHAGEIEDLRTVRRDRALADLKANPAYAQALAVLPDNPLPDAIVVTLKGEDLAKRSEKLAAIWKTWTKVDLVQVDSAWVQRLEAILRFARAALLFLAVVVAVAVLAAVFNTVRMQALAQREEIGVARLVGATESFVRRPFLYLGAVSCAAAALAAIGLVAVVLDPLNAALADLARSYGTEFALRLPQWEWLAAFVVGVALLGALSARWSVTRNTRF